MLTRIELVQTPGQGAEFRTQPVDSIDGIEEIPKNRTRRNVVAVLLPIEVIAQWSEQVVEVGDLVAEIVDRANGPMETLGLVVGRGGEIFLQRILLLEDAQGPADLVGLGEDVGGPVFLVLQVFDVADISRTDLKRDRRVHHRNTLGPGETLHLLDTGKVEDRFGDSFDDDHVGGIAQVVIGFDHQQFRVEPGRAEVPRGCRIAHVGG